MILPDISLLIVTAFLLLTLVIGLCCNKKLTTFRAYAVGDKQFSTAILVATLLATTFNGGLVYRVALVHQFGLYSIISYLLSFTSFWIISLLALHMSPFMQHLSVAETMGRIYGKYPRVITALSNTCAAVPMIASQISVMSFAISMCMDSVNTRIMTLVSILIFIVYTIFGGIRSVTLTDVLQSITFTIIIALLAKFMFAKTEKTVLEIVAFLPAQKKFQLSGLYIDNIDIKPIDLVSDILIYLLLYMGHAPVIQRVYMASGPIQVKKVFLYASFSNLLITFTMVLVGLFVFVRDPELPETEIWNYIIANVPPFFKGCIAVSLLGLAMSTADSYLHACSVMVSHDMMESIRGVKEASSLHKIRLAKVSSLVVGLVAMILAFYCNDLKKLSSLSYNLYVSVVTPPFFLAVLGFRGTSRTALIGMAVGALATLFWDIWDFSVTVFYCFGSTLANGLAMMAEHHLLPQPPDKGWVGLDDQQKRIRQLIRVFKKYKKMLELE